MPSCRIYTHVEHDVTDADLDRLNDIIIDGLEARGERAAVVVSAAKVNNSGCYVELFCRHKPNRTPELRRRLAERLDQAARTIFGIKDPVRVRIIMINEDELAGVN